MKAIVINAGPKRKGINAQIARSALKGAQSVESEVKYVDLYKMDLHGCMSCLICKKEGKSCKCYWRDELSPLIDEILDADCLLISAPIFFSNPTSHYMAFLERLIFCIVSYDVGNAFRGNVNVGLFYTINYPLDYFEKSVRPHLKQSEDLLEMLNGNVVIDTFSNISQNVYSKGDEESIKLKEKQFEEDLNKVFEISAELCR